MRSLHSPWYRRRAADQAAIKLHTSKLLSRARSVASYINVNHEFPTARINQTILEHGLELRFPVIVNYEKALMRFAPWKLRTKFELNRYAIPEPVSTIQSIDLIQPDLILLPLLGFDNQGNRIGMGGGYYDRYLGSLPRYKKPVLIGLAFNNQSLASINCSEFDIPIDGILTESGLLHF